MKTIEEFIGSLDPGEVFTFKDLVNKCGANLPLEATTLREIAQELLCLNGWYENNNEGKPKWTVFK